AGPDLPAHGPLRREAVGARVMTARSMRPRLDTSGARDFFADSRNQMKVVAALIVATIIYGAFYNDIRQNSPLAPLFEALPFPSVNVLIVMCYYGILALGLNIVVGFAGLLD